MKRILITGGLGYIGSVTSDLFLSHGFEVLIVDNLVNGYLDVYHKLAELYSQKVKFIQLDLKDGDYSVLDSEAIDAVIHFAGLANVGQSWEDPSLYFSNNMISTERLADYLSARKIKRLVFSSSCTVYGDAEYTPIDEKHPLSEPASPYGATKLFCEQILTWYAKTNLLDTVFLRYFNVTGASDNVQFGDSKKPSYHLIQNAVRASLGLAEFELNFAQVNTPDGSPIRDYVNVVDLANAHLLAINFLFDHPDTSEIFNIGTGVGNSVLEIIDLIKQKTQNDFKVSNSANPRKNEADKMIADYAKAKQLLGWSPTHSLSDSIDSLLAWYRARPQGWDK